MPGSPAADIKGNGPSQMMVFGPATQEKLTPPFKRCQSWLSSPCNTYDYPVSLGVSSQAGIN
jgi:hypothetical protein